MKRNRPSKSGDSPVKIVFLSLSILVIVGIFVCVFLAPSEYVNGPSTNSVISGTSSDLALSQRILDWLPRYHVDEQQASPNWNLEFWTPIDVDVSSEPIVILCKLNFRKYSESPHLYPMFKDLVSLSSCKGSNRQRKLLSTALKEIQGKDSVDVVKPTGFVFHESRVGSTLIANALASDPWSIIFSESAPIANAIMHAGHLTTEKQVQLLQDVVTVMGHSPIHKRLFFKFQSITVTKMELVLKAFPLTPWVFVYRKPIQTMMSHLDPLKGKGAAPCLRSKRSPSKEVLEDLPNYATSSSLPNEAWCAAHLNMLCKSALRAMNSFGQYNSSSLAQRGLFINYESLPGIIPQAILPLFEVIPTNTWLTRMKQEVNHYSKARGMKNYIFQGDSEDKDARATLRIKQYSEEILDKSYSQLEHNAVISLSRVLPALEKLANSDRIDWKILSSIPGDMYPFMLNVSENNEAYRIFRSTKKFAYKISEDPKHIPHSTFIERDYTSWAPFANHHNSRRYQKIDCPEYPSSDYPLSYPIVDITNNWNTDDTDIPEIHYDSLCHFNFQNKTDLMLAYRYRDAEVPFVVYNIPEVDTVASKWNDIDYLGKLLGSKKYRTETSRDNHFMYWSKLRGSFARSEEGKQWHSPTNIISSKFDDWLELAVKGQNKSLDERNHQYFRVSSDLGNPWLSKELPFFKQKKTLFMVDPTQQRGIHCRFGMRSVIAEAHFDGSRNSVVMLGGLRRWILAHPKECVNMHMLPVGHPSGRHSAVDWSKPDYEKYPNFGKVVANEVILQPGDFLFVPTNWIHYIVSLNINFQCNARSGRSNMYDGNMKACGF